MKKLIAFASLALIAGSSFAAATVVKDADATTGITNAECSYISTTVGTPVKLTRSRDVAAIYECTSSGVLTGAAHMTGKKHGYISSTAGGAQVEAALTANPSSQTADAISGTSEWTTAKTNLGT